MIKRLCLTLFVLGALFAGCSKEKTEAPATVGSPAPDFTLRDLAGHEVRLADLRGNVALVNFWATWCPPCREEIPSMLRLNRAMVGKPFRMLAISIDEGGKQAVEAYLSKDGAALPVLLDTDRKIGKRYGITGVPETFIIDRKGVIMKKVIGPLAWDDPAVVKFIEDAFTR
ncbi:MAG: TlpA disulfide reductase family protein [Geobacteraceae bacterium]